MAEFYQLRGKKKQTNTARKVIFLGLTGFLFNFSGSLCIKWEKETGMNHVVIKLEISGWTKTDTEAYT